MVYHRVEERYTPGYTTMVGEVHTWVYHHGRENGTHLGYTKGREWYTPRVYPG